MLHLFYKLQLNSCCVQTRHTNAKPNNTHRNKPGTVGRYQQRGRYKCQWTMWDVREGFLEGEAFEPREGTGEMEVTMKASYALVTLEAANVGRLNVTALKTSFSMFTL